MKPRRIIVPALLLLLVVIQFFRPEKNAAAEIQTADLTTVVKVPDNIRLILNTSCYDCHSNNTRYPWYSEIMPFGWWLNNHVKEGKEHLNFSVFATYPLKKQDHKLEEIKEEVEEGEMPLDSYTWIHHDARLSAEQIRLIAGWVTSARKELGYQK